MFLKSEVISTELNFVMVLLMVLLSVSFFTLLERNILGFIQLRKGPNKVSIGGILQAVADGLKLFSNELMFLFNLNKIIYFFSPVILFLVSYMLWYLYPYYFNLLWINNSILVMVCIMSISVYPIMYGGFSSNGIYSMMGSIRSVGQIISYEVSMILIMLSYMLIIESLELMDFVKYQFNLDLMFMLIFQMIMLLVSFIAELNRSPFDFTEGESELISGFNIEYFSGLFSLIFLGEYSNILFLMMIFCLLNISFNSIMFIIFWLILLYVIILIRGVLPRFRYDKLMYLIWYNYLPSSLCFLIFLLEVKLSFMIGWIL